MPLEVVNGKSILLIYETGEMLKGLIKELHKDAFYRLNYFQAKSFLKTYFESILASLREIVPGRCVVNEHMHTEWERLIAHTIRDILQELYIDKIDSQPGGAGGRAP